MNTFASHASKSFTSGDRTKTKTPPATEVSRIAELLQSNGTVVEKGLEIIRKLCYNDILKCNALTGQSHTDRKEEPIT